MIPSRLPVVSVVLGVVVAAFLAVATISTRTAPDTYPVADTAATSVATLQAVRGSLRVGSYSRFGWNHPGPLLYQILAGPYELSGRREIALKWTALALNLAWIGGLLALVGRRAPPLAIAVALTLIPLLWREQRLLFTAWNPFVTVLALAFAVAAAADLATGRAWRTRLGPAWLAVALSFGVQAHVGLLLPAAVCVLAAAIGLMRLRSDDGTRAWTGIHAGIAMAGVVVAGLWLVPLAAEIRDSPGNLATMIAFLSDGNLPRRTWLQALPGAAYMTLGPFLPSWGIEFSEVPATLPRWLPASLALLVVATAISAWHLQRRGRAYEAALAAIAAAASVAAVVSARGIVGQFNDYLLIWAAPIGALDVAVIVIAVAGSVPMPPPGRAAAFVRAGGLAVTCVVAWAVIGGQRLIGKHDEQARDTSVRALALDLQAYCERAGVTRPLLAFAGDSAWGEAAGLVLQFDKQDRPIAISDDGVFLVGRTFARTGREDATFFVMPTTGASLPAGAVRTEWITTRGEYRIVRLWPDG